MLHKPILTAGTAHRRLVPLGQGIGDPTGKGSRGSLPDQGVIEHQQIRTTRQHDIRLEGTLRRIKVGQGRPAGAGGGTQGNRDAGEVEATGQQFPCIENLATAGGDHGITRVIAMGGQVAPESLQIVLAAIELKLGRVRGQACMLQVGKQLSTNRSRGAAAAEQQRRIAEGSNLRKGLRPGTLSPQHRGRRDGVGRDGCGHQTLAPASWGVASARPLWRTTTFLFSSTSTSA